MSEIDGQQIELIGRNRLVNERFKIWTHLLLATMLETGYGCTPSRCLETT